VLITLPERRLAGWAKGEVVSEELWNHTVSHTTSYILLSICESALADYGRDP
jgi:hypothetical protein